MSEKTRGTAFITCDALNGLNAFAREVRDEEVARGEWESRSMNDQLQACRCFVEQAIREDERAFPAGYIYSGSEGKPCGIPFALADCMLHILAYCAQAGIDIEKYLATKRAYDKSHFACMQGKK